ncbi:MAG: methylated-DNA--[protein]-cysteine S-methyltransferase [Candidatus Sumerlaeia bacterium]|nr:methylated-DNA--[protein]-cysteine S-methyltransferase [Candidatus Sumerlaeia bacterium]
MNFRCFVVTYSIDSWLRLTVISTVKGICRIVFSEGSPDSEFGLKSPHQKLTQVKLRSDFPDFMADAIKQLLAYFNGENKEFSVPLDVSEYSPYLQKVWRTTMTIPYGQIRSYAWVAMKAGSPQSVRAVGQAMRLNPVPPIIPCHRVIRTDGSLGGYSAGLHWKIKLLELEGITVRRNKIYLHNFSEDNL